MLERIDFSRRAELQEEMDGPCSFEELRHCLRDLALVNRLTLAHEPVMAWLNAVAELRPRSRIRIVDMGCGYGDMLRRIERWSGRRGLPVELIGVDINANAIRAACEASPRVSRIQWIHGDVYDCAAAAEADVVTTSGVIHHLAEPEIVRFLSWAEQTSRVGWFIADLYRSALSYHVFDKVMRLGAWHRFIRPDGLLSIRRSFRKEDWRCMCAAAGLDPGTIELRHSLARLCVGRVKPGKLEG